MTQHYLKSLIDRSDKYLKDNLTQSQYDDLISRIDYIYALTDTDEIVQEFCKTYIQFVKEVHQSQYAYDDKLDDFITSSNSSKKLIWGDCYDVLKAMKNESVQCMVTSPPYYNARSYAQWENITTYLDDMEKILRECYRVLDNHRVFVFNVGDIYDNDHLDTTASWGKRRLPLGAYFISLFEKIGFTFVDDIIWDKGEVQSERHKNGNRPYPFYQYPMNCYEHILIFHKHRVDELRYPCPICGSLNVNNNSFTEKGLLSWECKNKDCFSRSESNRGKRYTAKTINTQSDIKNKGSEIDNDFIYSWRRDIKKLTPVIKVNSKGINTLGHTAPFPSEIPEFATRMFSYVGDVVLDPFSGLGTSLRTASALGRVGIGIERDETLKESVYDFVGGFFLDEYQFKQKTE